MRLSNDPRFLRQVALFAAFLAVTAVAVALVRNPRGEALLLVGALLAIVSMIGFVRRLGLAALEARRELRSLRGELREVQSALERRIALFREICDELQAAILLCDPASKLIYANRAAEVMFEEEQAGQSLLEFTLSNDLRGLFDEAKAKGEAKMKRLSLSHPRERQVLAFAKSVEDAILIVVEDVTELARLERIRTDFVANVSHELRTPLASIRALAETLRDEPSMPPDERDHQLKLMIGEVDRLAALSQDLLTLSAAESRPAEIRPADLSQIAIEIAEQYRPQAERKGLRFETNIEPNLVIPMDKDQIVQVLANLLSNAIRYTQEGSVNLVLAREGDQVVITVQDTGIGIAQEDIPRIFERFYRVDKARSRETGGTGLGLSIVRHIVNAHGGKVTVQSRLGEGSTFKVFLPAQRPA